MMPSIVGKAEKAPILPVIVVGNAQISSASAEIQYRRTPRRSPSIRPVGYLLPAPQPICGESDQRRKHSTRGVHPQHHGGEILCFQGGVDVAHDGVAPRHALFTVTGNNRALYRDDGD